MYSTHSLSKIKTLSGVITGVLGIAGASVAQPLPSSVVAAKPSVSRAALPTITPTPAEAPSSKLAPNADAGKLRALDVVVNGSKAGTWLFLERNDNLFAPRDAFDDWRVQLNKDVAGIMFKGQEYFPLASVLGYKAKLNALSQSVDLLFAPAAFSATRLQQELIKKPVISPVMTSAFLNYDFNYARSSFKGAPNVQDLGLLGELGFSSQMGVLTNSFTARNLTRNTALSVPSRPIRLETTFTRDFPDKNTTFRVGDSVTRSGLLGRSVYFAGVQFARNFSLSPGYVTQPIPVVSGISAAPSTVELYINDVLRQTSKVPTGPFTLDNLPTLTGNGDARLVVRDLLGRETIITQSFFTNGRLLATGLSDWSFEAGRVRRDLGNTSGRYGGGFANGLWRQGITPQLTFEGRATLATQVKTLQVGAIAGLPFDLLGSSAVTASHDNRNGSGGTEWLVGLEHRTLNTSTYIQSQGASQRFRQLGEEDNLKPTKQQLAANWTRNFDESGSFGLGYAATMRYDSPKTETFSANYSVRVGETGMLSLSANRVRAEVTATSVGLNFTMQLDKNRTVNIAGNSRGDNRDLYAVVAQNPYMDNQVGWRVLAGQQQNRSRFEAATQYQGQRGAVTADLSRTPNQTALRLGLNGALLLADGDFFVTQRLRDSFGIAEVTGFGEVGVGLGSAMTNYTNDRGVAVIARMSPYQNNQVRLNPAELPLTAEVDSIEQTVVPAWRSGVKISFPVHSGRGALLKIVFDDGEVAPAGALISINDAGAVSKEAFYVARRGEAFVTGLQTKNRLTLSWKDQRCQIELDLPPVKADDFPRVGPLRCSNIKR